MTPEDQEMTMYLRAGSLCEILIDPAVSDKT